MLRQPWVVGSGKALCLAFLVLVSNDAALARASLLAAHERPYALAAFCLIWAGCLLCLTVAAFQPRAAARVAWGAVLGAAGAVGFGYRSASGSELSVFDALALWNARHEATRAFEAYGDCALAALGLAILGFVVLAAPPQRLPQRLQRWLAKLAWLPGLPVAMIVAILLWKSGGGAQGLPQQFVPLATGLVASYKNLTLAMPPRRTVDRGPEQAPAARHVVLLVDESIRPEFLDFRPGNPFTPNLARLEEALVSFGQAASGGNCSAYANAILRLGARRDDLIGSIRTSPTIWQYAKRAGFRTVYIDAQGAHLNAGSRLQNFMTVEEAAQIDELVVLRDPDAPNQDFRLLEVVRDRLKASEPTFLYANKNGAHIPYDRGYPPSEAVFKPVAGGIHDVPAPLRLNSYRNVVRWSVDRFFDRLLGEADLSDAAVIYTSDHGQNFRPGKFTHCSTSEADPREALVPLVFLSGRKDLKARFADAARMNRNRADHFAIFPTLLQLMGYAPQRVAQAHGASLLDPLSPVGAFTSGDIFGLFGAEIRWNPIDLSRDYAEEPGREGRQAATRRSQGREDAGSEAAREWTGR